MSDIQKYEGKKRKAIMIISIGVFSAVLLFLLFKDKDAVDARIYVFLCAGWIFLIVGYQIDSCKMELLKKIEDTRDGNRGTEK